MQNGEGPWDRGRDKGTARRDGTEHRGNEEEDASTVRRHARTRPWKKKKKKKKPGRRLCEMAVRERAPRHKTRGIRGFILFHSILHGRQPPREYGIKLLRSLTEDDEIEGEDKEEMVVVMEGSGGGRPRRAAVVDIE